MKFAELLGRMTAAAARGTGAEVAACFTADGVYHDVFYGAQRGRAAIVDMIENRFHGDAADFVWELHDPVTDGTTGYARYTFSYSSRLPGCEGRRAIFEGVAICRLKRGLIAEYREIANVYPALSMLGFADERIARFAARQARELVERAGSRHREG